MLIIIRIYCIIKSQLIFILHLEIENNAYKLLVLNKFNILINAAKNKIKTIIKFILKYFQELFINSSLLISSFVFLGTSLVTFNFLNDKSDIHNESDKNPINTPIKMYHFL